MKNIVLVGSSGHAKVIIDIVEKQGLYKISGLIDAFRLVGEETLGYRVLGSEEDLSSLIDAHGLEGCIVAIGDNSVRGIVTAKITALCPQLEFVAAIHPSSSLGKDSTIGGGTVVMAGVVIGPSCRIGRSCIVNSRASLDHDSVMEDFSSLAPGVTTGGNCRIGSYSAVSIGSVVRHEVTIGAHTVIGAGAVVLRSIESFSIAYGVPARKVRDRKQGDKYL